MNRYNRKGNGGKKGGIGIFLFCFISGAGIAVGDKFGDQVTRTILLEPMAITLILFAVGSVIYRAIEEGISKRFLVEGNPSILRLGFAFLFVMALLWVDSHWTLDISLGLIGLLVMVIGIFYLEKFDDK